jgi:uncharacterized surface protein with fasciclin (FAS1) repeats
MTNFHISKTCFKYKITFLLFFLTSLLVTSCQEEPKLWKVKSTEQVAIDYIENHPEFSEFAKLIEVTGLKSLLGIRGPYTIMLPNNDAMYAYYKEKGVKSLMDFDETFRRKLALNHLITNELNTSDMGLGALRDTNAIGDFLVTEFQGSDIILNRQSKIIDRDVRLANGYAHVIDRVIEPVTKDIYTIISNDPSFKIFAEGLKITGLKDTLQQILFPYGNHNLRTRFTLFAVPDSIYQKHGINTVTDLIKWTGANSDNLNSLNNAFYRYMEYHCLTGTYFLSSLESQLYPILSHDNNILMTVDTDYKINFNPQTKKYTGFIVPASNNPAKNGAIHTINDLMPVVEQAPQTVLFECTDFFDIRNGDFFGKYYMKWNDGQNSLAKIKFEGDFLGYYYKNHDAPKAINYDALFMLGYWWIEVTFPKVEKGNYDIIYGSPWDSGTELADFSVEVDGVNTGIIYDKRKGLNQKIGTCEFKTTAEHKIKFRSISFGALYWDFIQFVPVK